LSDRVSIRRSFTRASRWSLSVIGFSAFDPMTPAARLQAVIDILGRLDETSQPADRALRDWLTGHRFAGSGDRRAISEMLFRILRHRASFAHRMGASQPRRLAIALLLADGADPASLFTGGYGPSPLTEDEQHAIVAAPGEAPAWAKGEYPQWLESELIRRFGENLSQEMAAMKERAPVDLRVNSLKAMRAEVLEALKADGFEAQAMGALAIRCPPGTRNLDKHPLYLSGAFEIQDLAAQTAAEQAGAKPGMRVLDLAAGAGGKSLALAAAMQNQGEIIACDTRGAALAELEKRAARAGATIIRTHILGDPPAGPFDLVFVDAPCSGSGTWRRQPELKWRLTPGRLSVLEATQDQLLAQAGSLAGTALIYATCSILPAENQDRIAGFLARNPGFRRAKPDFQASPSATGMDGFYAAFLTRT
jgi:16S rRNA (cytosine967-C5)-methyltransferase